MTQAFNNMIAAMVANTLANKLETLVWYQSCPKEIQEAIKNTIRKEKAETKEDEIIITLAGMLTFTEMVQGQG
jgi:hypothetical protein